MSRRGRRAKKSSEDPIVEVVDHAAELVRAHPLFSALRRVTFVKLEQTPGEAWGRIRDLARYPGRWAEICLFRRRQASPEDYAYVIALAHLHVGLNHLHPDRRDSAWFAACAVQAAEMVATTKIGRVPEDLRFELPPRRTNDLEKLYEYFIGEGRAVAPKIPLLSGTEPPWTSDNRDPASFARAQAERTQALAAGLRAAVRSALEVAGGAAPGLGRPTSRDSAPARAKQWFISQFPLLGALASAFTVIDDEEVCRAYAVSIAAINPSISEIYINPKALLSEGELRLVMAHEMLHVGLRHEARRQGRDPYLWNVACDYVINGWLIEMAIGEVPQQGILHDPSLAGRSAEDIYDEIVRNLRWRRKLAKLKTPKGVGQSDIIDDRVASWWRSGPGVDLDHFYRRALCEGLELHAQGGGRGHLPAGLVEEIKALSQPPIPWDVELAQWLDAYFPVLERRRTYARASRRQSASPNIPRPRWYLPEELMKARTFGVVLDTSGSMSRRELGLGLGAISAYAMSRDVPAVRLVYCDASPTDAGYLPPEELLDRVKVTGRGGTVLQPGIDLLLRAEDFPRSGPILVITDGACEPLRIPRDHAFLLAKGGRIPFPPKGPLFRMD